MIIPLMVDFAAYPLTDGHDRLRKTGETLGFEVLDLLPNSARRWAMVSKYRVHPGDNHFDCARSCARRGDSQAASRLRGELDRPEDWSRGTDLGTL